MIKYTWYNNSVLILKKASEDEDTVAAEILASTSNEDKYKAGYVYMSPKGWYNEKVYIPFNSKAKQEIIKELI